MQTFKGVLAGKSSALADALAKGNRKEAEKIFKETTERYNRYYNAVDREWFEKRQRNESEGI